MQQTSKQAKRYKEKRNSDSAAELILISTCKHCSTNKYFFLVSALIYSRGQFKIMLNLSNSFFTPNMLTQWLSPNNILLLTTPTTSTHNGHSRKMCLCSFLLPSLILVDSHVTLFQHVRVCFLNPNTCYCIQKIYPFFRNNYFYFMPEEKSLSSSSNLFNKRY